MTMCKTCTYRPVMPIMVVMRPANPEQKLKMSGGQRVNTIIEAVCYAYGIDLPDIKGQSRKREYVEARQIAMTLISDNIPAMNLKAIGRQFGGRDHSTVIYAKNTVHDLCDSDKKFKAKFEKIKQQVKELVN